MKTLPASLLPCAAGLLLGVCHSHAAAQDFDWQKFKGQTITFLVNTNATGNAIMKYKADFEKLTGMTLKMDVYQEQQMRQRLLTAMNARSDEIDVFMSLPSREKLLFAKSGWYADLGDLIKRSTAKDYDYAGLSPAMIKDATYNNQIIGIPLNVEGPVLYTRKDVFQRCGVAVPKTLAELQPVAAKLKACDASITPFVSRGLKPALAYTYSVFLHNMGGEYMKGGKSQLCSKEGQESINLYSTLLKDYSVPGVVNYSFYQITTLYREGKAAMAFESTSEFPSVMNGGARLKDTAVSVLPRGPGGSHPTVIGWVMSISGYSKSKEAAWYFVQWATSPAMQAKLALDGIAPPRASAAATPEFKKWLEEEPVRKDWAAAVNELGSTGTAEVGYPIIGNPASRDYIGEAVDDVLLGQKPVAQACADADRQLDALIAKDQ